MHYLAVLIAACVLLWAPVVHGQAHKHSFEHLTVLDGLPENSGTALLEDRYGFIWIGTQNGLVRHDGFEMRAFLPNPGDSLSLSFGQVSWLHEDASGSLWVGTANGLNRFDRDREAFDRFIYRSELDTIRAPVWAIADDPRGYVWTIVGSEMTSAELWRVESGSGEAVRFRHDPRDEGSISAEDALGGPIKAPLHVDSRGDVWVGTFSGGLNRYDADADRFIHFRHDPADARTLSSNSILAIYEAPSEPGILWIAAGNPFTRENLSLNRLDVETGYVERVGIRDDGPPTFGVAFHETSDGQLWIGGVGALHRFDRATGGFESHRFRPPDPSDNTIIVSNIQEVAGGVMWLQTVDGGDVWTFDLESAAFEHITRDPERPDAWPSTRRIWSLLSDRSGTIWVGTWSQGIVKIDPARSRFPFHEIRSAEPGAPTQVLAVHDARDGRLWLGTHPDGLIVLDPATGSYRQAGPPLARNPVTGIGDAGNGLLWLAITTGPDVSRLVLFDPETERLVPIPGTAAGALSEIEGIARSILTDEDGITWVAVDRGGLHRIGADHETVKQYVHDADDPASFPDAANRAFFVFEDDAGELWVSTNAGLARFDRHSETFHPFLDYGRGLFAVSTMANAGEGRFWLGGYISGLLLFDPELGSVQRFGEAEGLAHNTVFSIARDDDGVLWLATGRGLSRFDPSTETFENFDRSDGLNLAHRPILSRTATGALVYSGAGGIHLVRPAEIEANPRPPRVALTGLHLFQERVWPNQDAPRLASASGDWRVALPHDQNMVTFEFAGLHSSRPERIAHAYRLDNFDEGWIEAGSARSATYTNLPPGRYVFRARAANADGVWSEAVELIHLHILPPWWRTGWAYSLYVLMFAGGVFGADRFQRRRLIARERERARERELQQKREIERAYEELKRTQAQLVQQEKLASLGALTAGIAHEIKNPLNFVNNFGRLTAELVEELQEDLVGHPEARDAVQDLLVDLRTNASKIEEHGRRADAIVRSMLEHSRGGTGKRQAVDLNALVEEYVNLAYHGRRAQQSGFEVTIERDLAPELPLIEVVPQEVGRVILNLVGNAFDAVADHAAAQGDDYEPRVRVSTRSEDVRVVVVVEDNGPGIPEAVQARIFEPFFTTKAAGQGTGLGLSMSHEIITQGHGGSLRVESSNERGTRFVVTLPAN